MRHPQIRFHHCLRRHHQYSTSIKTAGSRAARPHEPALQAYFPKKPLNFGQHFLETCHASPPRSGVDLHQYHMERAPPPKNRKNMSGSQNRPFPLGKVTFFQAENADFSARVARFFRKFWRSSGAKGRGFSLGFSSSEKTEGTLPEELGHAASIALGGARSRVRLGPFLRPSRTYLHAAGGVVCAAKPVVIYAKNYALFVRPVPHQSQRPSEKRRGSSRRDPGDVDS